MAVSTSRGGAAAIASSEAAARPADCDRKQRSSRLMETTNTLENAMAAPAINGLS
jgi:hypothetical protein